MQDILNAAQQQYNAGGGINQQFVQKSVADYTPEMKEALGNLMDNTGLYDIAKGSSATAQAGAEGLAQGEAGLQGLTSGGVTSNDIANAAKGLYQSDLVNNQIAQAKQASGEELAADLQQINQGATATGNMGSSRAGVASGVAAGKVNQSLQNTVANIQDQARQQAFSMAAQNLQNNQQTNLQASQALGQLGSESNSQYQNAGSLYNQMGQNQLTAAGITQTQAQNQADIDWYNKYGQQNQGWENLGKYSDIVSGIGSAGGTSVSQGTSAAPKQSTFNQILGMGSSIAGIASLFSDETLKTNIQKVGEDSKGNPRYSWDWNEDAAKLGLKGKGEGVLAQQIAQSQPDAVSRDAASGKLKVDYDKVGGVKAKVKKVKR